MPQRVGDQVMQADAAGALGVGLARLEGDDVRVLASLVQVQLVFRLQGGDPLTRWYLAGERPEHRRLSAVNAAGDNDVAAAFHGGGEEDRKLRIDGAQCYEPGQRGLRLAVPAQ